MCILHMCVQCSSGKFKYINILKNPIDTVLKLRDAFEILTNVWTKVRDLFLVANVVRLMFVKDILENVCGVHI